MIRELDPVVLTRDLKAHGLREGDMGVVVYSHGEAYEVEFVTPVGETRALLTLTRNDIRSRRERRRSGTHPRR